MATNVVTTDADLYTILTEDILDEDISEEAAARFLSSAKNEIERNEKPYILMNEDTSKTRASGDTYTSFKALPTDFRQMIELYVGTTPGLPPYIEIPFYKRHQYRLANFRYYIDHKNSQFAICGTAGASETIRQVYLIKTDDITSATITGGAAATIVWPAELRELVAWKAAEIISRASDLGADDLSFRMGAEQLRRYEELMRSFRNWDQDLKLKAQDGRAGMDDYGEYPDIEDTLPYL